MSEIWKPAPVQQSDVRVFQPVQLKADPDPFIMSIQDGNQDAISIGAQNRPRPGFTPEAER
jgi:hypothetical protein